MLMQAEKEVSGRMEASGGPVLALKRVTKKFPGVKALSEVSLDLFAGKVTALRAPVSARDLKEACEADLALAAIRNSSLGIGDAPVFDPAAAQAAIIPEPEPGEEVIPARQYTDSQLSKYSQISTAINCECPHHLAALLSALNAFELYSRDCENRNAEDAALHAYLHRRTARARAIMEDALAVLAEVEGITVS